MQSNIPRRVQSSEERVQVSVVERAQASAVKRTAWSVDGGITRRLQLVPLPANTALSGQPTVFKEAICVLCITVH